MKKIQVILILKKHTLFSLMYYIYMKMKFNNIVTLTMLHQCTQPFHQL